MKKTLIALVLAGSAFAQNRGGADRLMQAYQDRVLTESTASLKTDEHISMYEMLVKAQPDVPHYHNLLAGAYIQKVRETVDFSYLERASLILQNVLAQDAKNYEAQRLRTEIALERHDFHAAAQYSEALTQQAPNDSWNWGTLGDAYTELGNYEKAAEAYQKMVNLRPDLSSYNRAAYFRFLYGDPENGTKIMKMAIAAGSPMAENTAWCQVELGKMYLKTGKLKDAEEAYSAALRNFPNYHPALAGLAQTQAAKRDWKAAIANMKRAQASVPMPDYAAALYDFYTAAGDAKEAKKQKEMIEVIDQVGQAAQEKANRNIAIIFADHDWNLNRALELAQNELEVRGDVYTYDALAWALFKNKKFAEAGEAMQKALKLGTPEPAFYYHAGLIENALGHKEQARELLKKAKDLNPALVGETPKELS
jgi:tetratricopeptide (TPR) repeat protein